MVGGGIAGLLILAAIVIGGIVVVRRVLGKREGGMSDGGDVIAYLLLALAVGTTGFSLAALGQAAFPGDSFVFDTNQRVATALAGLVVGGPIAVFLWRRQAGRRRQFPVGAGWTVYLSLIEAVFMTATVLAGFSILDWLLGEGGAPTWTNLIVFGGVVGFHEWAAIQTPATADGGGLPRVVGSAIGLVTVAIGLGGTLYWLFERLYSTLSATAGGPELGTAMSALLVGLPVWWYRWWRPWPSEPGTPRHTWLFLTSVVGFTTVIAVAALTFVQVLLYLFTDTEPAGSHFEFLPGAVAVGVVGLLVWAHHRQKLGHERNNPLRAYTYAMAALGLGTTIGGATALTAIAFSPADFIGTPLEAVLIVATILITGLMVWYWFWSRAALSPRELEAVSGPRRFYLIGMAIVTGLTSAGALIGTLVVIFQQLLGTGDGETLAVQASLFVFSGLAAWHLLRLNAQDRDLMVSEEIATPFEVTIICSHPGMIATRFPKAAKLRVVYRADDSGPIGEEMAAAIVDAVGNRSSLVWVDADGFRVAPAR